MKLKSFVLLLSIIFILVGCNSKPSLSQDDIGIRKVDDPKAKVIYGMSREDAEKVLGTGKKNSYLGFDYENGVTVYYRDDNVVGVLIDGESKGIYETTNCLGIGVLESEVEKRFGKDGIKQEAFIDYIYDTDSKMFLGKDAPRKQIEDDMERVFIVSVRFDDNGYANFFSLLDQRMAIFTR
ncbi:hypothetical protein D1872_205910 [compost metagenome]